MNGNDETGRERTHAARKALFARALREGAMSLQEVERVLPTGILSEAEHWLLLASLRCAGVILVDERTGETDRGLQPPVV